MKRNIWIGIGIVVVVALAILLIVTQTRREPEEIKIGAILPLTGKMAAFGENQQLALLLAEKRVNAARGINGQPLKFIFEDSKADPKEAVAAVNKLITIDKVKIMFVFKSTLINAIQPITDKAKVLMVAFAMDPEITTKSEYTFRIYPNMRQQTKVMIEYIRNSKAKRMGILYVVTPATQHIIPKLKSGLEQLGKTVATASFEEEDRDIRTQVLKLKQTDPDMVITLAHFVFIPMILKTFEEMGLLAKIDILGDLSYTFDRKISSALLEGIHFVSPHYALKTIESSSVSWFEEKFKEKSGRYPGYDPCFFFDAAMILADGLKHCGNNIEKLKTYLSNVTNYQGITGPITIEKDGDAKVDMVIGVFQDGKRLPVK